MTRNLDKRNSSNIDANQDGKKGKRSQISQDKKDNLVEFGIELQSDEESENIEDL